MTVRSGRNEVMFAGRLLRTKISIPGSGDFTIMSSETSGVCADAAVAIMAAMIPPTSALMCRLPEIVLEPHQRGRAGSLPNSRDGSYTDIHALAVLLYN